MLAMYKLKETDIGMAGSEEENEIPSARSHPANATVNLLWCKGVKLFTKYDQHSLHLK